MSNAFEPEPEPEIDDDHYDDGGESLIDRLRGTGVGVEDPNIVGDVGPTDIPPGPDPASDGLFADPPVGPPTDGPDGSTAVTPDGAIT